MTADITGNPGSPDAIKRGCRCPIIDNGHGHGANGTSGPEAEFWINSDCPMHGWMQAMVETDRG